VVGLIAAAESGDPPVGYLIPTEGLTAAWPELAALALPPCPFRGLSPFQEADGPVFFGRQAESDELADIVAGERWTTLVGPSGCGKSSLAMAGVIPRRRDAGDRAVVLRPALGASPLRALAAGTPAPSHWLRDPQSAATHQCILDDGSSTNSSVGTCSSSAAYTWTLRPSGSGTFQLVNRASGRCITETGFGGPVWVEACGVTNDNSRWRTGATTASGQNLQNVETEGCRKRPRTGAAATR
jgi:hypothetical protein